MKKHIRHQTSNIKQNKGVTLIELSIVVIIIGLVVTGVISGQQLMENHKITSLIKDRGQIEGYFNSFQLQYKALPGDYNEAYALFGSKCASSASFCDGNGDGYLTKAVSIKAWKQMDAAEVTAFGLKQVTRADEYCASSRFLPKFTFDTGAAIFDYISGIAVSASGTAMEFNNGSASANIPYQSFVFSNALANSTTTNLSSTSCGATGFLNVEQAYLFDKKSDDGFASTGKVLGSTGDTSCLVGSPNDWNANGGTDIFCKVYVGNLKVY